MINYIDKLLKGDCEGGKAKIMKAALEEFAMYSLSAARTRHIASLAGVNHAAISYYFGGKKELYLELIHQIIEFVEIYMSEYFERSKEILISKDSKKAEELIIDFMMSRICKDTEGSTYFKYIILILNREEVMQTEAFEEIFEHIYKPSIVLVENMFEIASKDKSLVINKKLAAEIIIGQVLFFNSTKIGAKRINGWDCIGDVEYAQIKETLTSLLKKCLS